LSPEDHGTLRADGARGLDAETLFQSSRQLSGHVAFGQQP
jgi:hypothetical protein